MEQMESGWTEAGSRIIGELTQHGSIILTCQSQAVFEDKDTAKISRGIVWVAQLGIPVATIRSDADRLVRHWLAFFEDEVLARNGLKLFRDLVDSVPESAPASQPPIGVSGMN